MKRIIPCLDVKDGRVVKGVNFKNLKDVSSPVTLAQHYCRRGADELAVYDINASLEGRALFAGLIKEIAGNISVPLIAGGGISSLEDFDMAFRCGAGKVSVNTGALKRPALISEAAKKYGKGRVVLSVDVKRVDEHYIVFLGGGKQNTGLCALDWIKTAAGLGAGEVVVNSIDADGARNGFDMEMLRAVCGAVSIPVIASGGAGCIGDFARLFREVPDVDAGLAASVFHFGVVDIKDLKENLRREGIDIK